MFRFYKKKHQEELNKKRKRLDKIQLELKNLMGTYDRVLVQRDNILNDCFLSDSEKELQVKLIDDSLSRITKRIEFLKGEIKVGKV